MKTIAVIGANGRSGTAFVEAALKNGYSVRAGVHSTSTLRKRDGLEIISIDATNSTDITQLIIGADVVVSLMGHVKGSPEHLQTDAIKVVIAAMEHLNIQRIISLTGTGVRFENDKISLADWVLNTAFNFARPKTLRDGIAHANALQRSPLDWTIIRALKLTNGKAGRYRLVPHGPAKFFTPRREIALAILEVIEHDSFIKQAPTLS
jgi:putative NADH-flavin reductase